MMRQPDQKSDRRARRHHDGLARSALLCLGLMLSGCDEKSAEDYYQKALQHRSNGEIAASIIELKNALQAAPNDAEARLLLGTIYLEVRNLASAEKELIRARDLGVASDRLVEPLADLWLAQGDFQKILDELPRLSPSGAPQDAPRLLAEAQAYQGLNRLAEARLAYAAALDLQADNLRARYGLAWTARQIGDFAAARSALDAALQLQPDNPDFIALKADLDTKEGNQQQAEEGYRTLLRLQPDNLNARASLAGILFGRHNYREATEQLDVVLAAQPSHGNANYLRAAIAVEGADYETAKRLSERVILTNPNHVPSLLIAASANYAIGLLEQAERYATRVLELAPDHEFAGTLRAAIHVRTDEGDVKIGSLLIDDFARPADVASYMDSRTERWLLRQIGMDCLDQVQSDTGGVDGAEAELSGIRVAIDNGNLDLALSRTQEAERVTKTRKELRREFAKLYLELDAFHDLHRVVEDLLAGGGATDAETMCLASPAYLTAAVPGKALLASRSLIELMPNSAVSYLLLANAYRNPGERDRYAEALTQAFAIAPAYPPLVVEGIRSALAQGDATHASDLLAGMDKGADYRMIRMDFQGGLALLRGEYSAAAEMYRAALAADPGSTRALKRAYALTKAGEPEKSREALAEWLVNSSHDDAALLALANKDLAAERYLEAAEGYSSVLLLQPNNVLALNNLAWISVSLGEAGVAVQHAERAFHLASKDARIVDTLGYTLMRKGDMSRAKTLLERANALAPENLQIRLHLAEALIGHGQVDEAKKLLRSVLSQEGDPGAREQAAKLMNDATP